MTPDELAALMELEAKATPGPWGHGYWSGQCHQHAIGKHPGEPRCTYDYTLIHDEGESGTFDNPHLLVSLSEPGALVTGNYDYEEGGVIHEADAAFIAALRNAAPSLIADAREAGRLRAEVSEKAAQMRARTERTAISAEDWRYLNGYEHALRDLGILPPLRAALSPEPESSVESLETTP